MSAHDALHAATVLLLAVNLGCQLLIYRRLKPRRYRIFPPEEAAQLMSEATARETARHAAAAFRKNR